jgi:hypothetical protein
MPLRIGFKLERLQAHTTQKQLLRYKVVGAHCYGAGELESKIHGAVLVECGAIEWNKILSRCVVEASH